MLCLIFFKGITLVFCGQNVFVRARREFVGIWEGGFMVI